MGEFVVTDEERPRTLLRRQAVLGVRALRVPYGPEQQRVMAPCAFFAPSDPSLSDPSSSAAGSSDGPCLFEDPDGRIPLCSVDPARKADGERHHTVRDGAGTALGTLRRLPPGRHALRPTWRIEQPGRELVVSGAEWAKNGPKDMAAAGVAAVFKTAFQMIGDLGAEGGDQPGPRPLDWRSGRELVLTSERDLRFLIRAPWLDRRLVFAYALLRGR
ncbi:hypothetical protein [Streptomyces mangrovisoli]|uniref:hypothetical protein n=1 Tax=Streptomyces mangrovisoli TaxID=1428628 RepID=UPI0009A0E8B1|nr:hypothetical protein [Streptomyces mangrovisoli]